MNWIKDNLLFLMFLVLIGCGVAITGLLLSKAHLQTQYAQLEGDHKKLKADFSNVKDAADINAANVASISKLYNDLVEKRRLEQASATAKAAELDKLKAASAAMTSENQRLRAKLSEADPDVKTYLEAGMPQPLACQLWPQAEECP